MTRPNTMKALEKSHPKEGLWMVQAPVPEIGPDEVLIKINKTGICGTDIHIWNWDDWAAQTVPVGLITGHEFAGEIVELGRNVEGLEIAWRRPALDADYAEMNPAQRYTSNWISAPIVKNGIAYVPQGRMIFSSMTVQENVETGLTSTGEKSVPEGIYELFPVLLEMKGRRGGNLSGGQQQQLAIARALASDPKVLLLDEPTEGIQPSIIREMARTLRRIRDERNLSIIVSEQVLSFALDVADRVMVIENGQFVHDSPRDGIDADRVSKFLSV